MIRRSDACARLDRGSKSGRKLAGLFGLPQSLTYFSYCRRRIGAIFESCEPLRKFRGGIVKAAGKSGGFEGLRDFLHFTDVTPSLGCGDSRSPAAPCIE